MPELHTKPDVILHVDDSIDFLSLFSKLFGQHFQVVSAKSAYEAVDMLQTDEFDAVVTDYEMPGLNGLELLDYIKSKFPDIPVIFYTGQGNEKIAREAFIRGASDYFPKDVFGFAHKEKFLFSIKRAIETARTRKVVEETQERLRAVIETARDPIFIKDAEGRFIVFNPAFEILAGKNRDEIIGKNYNEVFGEFVGSEVIQRNILYDQATLEGNITEDNVTKYTNTGVKHYHTIKVPLKNSKGIINGICGIARDITQVKEARDALKKSEEKYRLLVNSTSDLIYSVDREGVITYVSQAVARMGYEISDSLGKSFLSFVHPDDQKRVLSNYSRFMEEGESFPDEFRMMAKNGEYRWVEDFGSPLKDENGQIVGQFGFLRDITTKKEAEQRLKVREENLQSIFLNAPIGLFRSTVDGIVLEVNKKFAQILGYSDLFEVDNFTNNPLTLKNFYLDPDVRKKTLEQAGKQPGTWHTIETSFRRKNDEVFKGQISYRIVPGDTSIVEGFLKDLSEEEDAQRALKESEQRFRTLVEHIPGIVWIVNKNLKYIYATGLGLKTYSYLDNNSLNITIYDYLKTSDPKHPIIEKHLLAVKGESQTFEQEYQGKIYHVNLEPIADSKGDIEYLMGIAIDITESREAESKLHNSEEKFRSLVDNLSEIVMRFDREHRHLFVNRAISHTLDLKPEDFIGKTHREMGFPPHLCDFWEGCIEKVFTTGEPIITDFEFSGINGNRIVDFRLYPEFGSDQKVTTVITISRDITEQKQVEDKIRASEETLQVALKGADLGFWDWFLDTGKVTFSKRYYEILGYEENEFKAGPENWEAMLHPDDKARITSILRDNLEGRIPYFDVEYRMKSKTGEWVWIQSRGRVIYRDPEGKPLRIAGTHLDITERKKTEHTLRETDKRYRMLAHNSNDVIWKMDLSGNFTYISPSVFELRGYTPEEIIGTHFTESICASSMEQAVSGIEIIMSELKTGTKAPVRYFELEQPCKDGSKVWIETTAWLMYDEMGTPIEVVGITRNIDSRKKAENRLLAINKELDDFTFMVSHDLKSPVNLIKSYLAAINEENVLFEQYFPKCMEQADKVFNYIDNLLQLSRVGKVIQEKQMLNLTILFRMYLNSIKTDLTYECIIQDGFPEICGDLNGMQTVFSNLFENSFRYHDENKEKLVINIGFTENEKSYVISFADNGLGIEPNNLEKIFTPGYSTGSTGFGLAISKKIIEAHHGAIWAESQGIGKGAVFFIRLPDFRKTEQ